MRFEVLWLGLKGHWATSSVKSFKTRVIRLLSLSKCICQLKELSVLVETSKAQTACYF